MARPAGSTAPPSTSARCHPARAAITLPVIGTIRGRLRARNLLAIACPVPYRPPSAIPATVDGGHLVIAGAATSAPKCLGSAPWVRTATPPWCREPAGASHPRPAGAWSCVPTSPRCRSMGSPSTSSWQPTSSASSICLPGALRCGNDANRVRGGQAARAGPPRRCTAPDHKVAPDRFRAGPPHRTRRTGRSRPCTGGTRPLLLAGVYSMVRATRR